MSSYVGRYAEFYDVIYADKPYKAEADFIVGAVASSLGKAPETWLDVACGTGTHALQLAEKGLRVTGVDYSRDQLHQAKRKASLSSLPVHFQHGDMRALDLGDQRFDAVSCLFDSIGYVQTNDAVVAALRGMQRCLAPSGVVVLEFWHAPAMLKYYEPYRVRRWPLPDGELVRISESTLDVTSQTCRVKYTLYVPDAGGGITSLTETQENRYFLLQEMRALLNMAGLQLMHAFAGYSSQAVITEHTWHIVALATRIE